MPLVPVSAASPAEVFAALVAAINGAGPPIVPYAAGAPVPSWPRVRRRQLPEGLAAVVATSGSTGEPKLVQLTAETELVTGPITARNAVAGKLTSTAWSESRAAAVALAWVDADVAKLGTKVAALTTRGTTTAEITREVFAKA